MSRALVTKGVMNCYMSHDEMMSLSGRSCVRAELKCFEIQTTPIPPHTKKVVR